jgi:GTP-binding protein Era
MEEIKKSGFITILGRPNVGKSTLLNRLAGQKIAIVTHKPQTTRQNITGILNEGDTQMVFVDTPGLHAPQTKLGEFMAKQARDASEQVDVTLAVVEPAVPDGKKVRAFPKDTLENAKHVIIVINKIDTKEPKDLLPVMDYYGKISGDIKAIIPVSAKTGDGISQLIAEIRKYCPEGPAFYPEDQFTDRTEREIIEEIIREKLLFLLDEEIPHGIAVQVVKMKVEKGKAVIDADIVCEKESHKGIVIGKNGEVLKKAGTGARGDIEAFLGRKVFLSLWVKVRENWRDSPGAIRDLGFKSF